MNINSLYNYNGKLMTQTTISKLMGMSSYSVGILLNQLPITNSFNVAPHITPDHWKNIKEKKPNQAYMLAGSVMTLSEIALHTGLARTTAKARIEKYYSKEERHAAYCNNIKLDVFNLFFWSADIDRAVSVCGLRKGRKGIYLINGQPLYVEEATKVLGIGVNAFHKYYQDLKVA